MACAADNQAAADLADRLERALEAAWRGDTTELDRLVNADETTGPGIGTLFGDAFGSAAQADRGYARPPVADGYEVVREIGRGGMGVVYEARQETPRRRVAMKVLHGCHTDEYHIKLFQREIDTLARLNHPAIATIYAAGRTADGQDYFTMELVAGVPLTKFARDTKAPVAQRLELFSKVCDALQHAHQHVIHRDLKPTNILANAGGEPKIVDFGLARITDGQNPLITITTDSGRIVGTLAYMSPEQAAATPETVDHRTDIYALGVVLYELLTDRLPYDLGKLSPAQALRVIIEEPPRPMSVAGRRVSDELETIAFKALAKDPAQRYQTAAELADDIRRYLRGETIRARRPSVLYFARKKVSKHWVTAGVAAALVCSGVAAALHAHHRHRLLVEGVRRGAADSQARIESGTEDAIRCVAEGHASLGQFPGLPEARLALAQAMFRAGHGRNDAQGRELIKDALVLLDDPPPDDPWRWAFDLLTAEIRGQMNDAATAAAARARAQSASMESAEAWYVRSFTTLFDTREARRCVEEAVRRDANHALAWARLAHLRRLTGDLEGALAAGEVCTRLQPQSQDAWMAKGRILAELGRYAAALAVFDEAIRRSPRDATLHRLRAKIGICMRDYATAHADLCHAEDYSAGTPWCRRERGTVAWILGSAAAAIADYEFFCDAYRTPSYAEARLYLWLRETGEDAKAEDVLGRARSQCKEVWLRRIYACVGGELAPESLVDAALADGDREHICESYYYAGERCLLEGQDREARAWFEKCVATNLVFDPNSTTFDVMHEYHLARWRLDQLNAGDTLATRPANP